MKKSIIAVASCLAVLLSASTTAFATNTINGDTSAEVKGSYTPLATPETVYSVDIQWGSLEFTYHAPKQVWNPSTHEYEIPEGSVASWTCETDEDETTIDANEVAVANRSNAGVDVTVTTDMGESGITATVSKDGKFALGSADATITAENPVGTETKDAVSITLEGDLSSEHEAGSAIGTVTVTLESAQNTAEPTE